MHRSTRRFVVAIMFIASAAVSLGETGCAAGRSYATRTARRPAAINHLAFFKLKNPVDAAELIADCDEQLGTLPMVAAYYCGQHLETGRGDRVDSTYDVGFYVGFSSEVDYSAYVSHPNHQNLVARWQPRWEWIRVQDVFDATP